MASSSRSPLVRSQDLPCLLPPCTATCRCEPSARLKRSSRPPRSTYDLLSTLALMPNTSSRATTSPSLEATGTSAAAGSTSRRERRPQRRGRRLKGANASAAANPACPARASATRQTSRRKCCSVGAGLLAAWYRERHGVPTPAAAPPHSDRRHSLGHTATLSVAMRKWLWPTFRDGTSPACRVASSSSRL